MRRPPRMIMQNGPPFIIDSLSPGGVLQGGVFQKFSNIYTTHPKTAPYQGMLNRYFPSRETPRRWRALSYPSDLRLEGGGWDVVSLTCMLQHRDSTPHQKLLCILHAEHPLHAPPKKRLGPGMFWDDAYVKINRMAS